MIGRKRLPAYLEAPYRAFLSVLDEIEPAKAGLADVLPTTRLPGRPLRDAVAEYRASVVAARPLMPGWRCPDLEAEWQACARGLGDAITRADRILAADGEPVGFEGLLGAADPSGHTERPELP